MCVLYELLPRAHRAGEASTRVVLFLLLSPCPLPNMLVVITGVGGGNGALKGFYTVLIPLLGPRWATDLDEVMLGEEDCS